MTSWLMSWKIGYIYIKDLYRLCFSSRRRRQRGVWLHLFQSSQEFVSVWRSADAPCSADILTRLDSSVFWFIFEAMWCLSATIGRLTFIQWVPAQRCEPDMLFVSRDWEVSFQLLLFSLSRALSPSFPGFIYCFHIIFSSGTPTERHCWWSVLLKTWPEYQRNKKTTQTSQTSLCFSHFLIKGVFWCCKWNVGVLSFYEKSLNKCFCCLVSGHTGGLSPRPEAAAFMAGWCGD